jgi:hypothetical protein
MCRIFCAKGITVSQIFCELLHFEMLVLENLEKSDCYIFLKELYWNTINFNDIRCNFKALLNIFLHFGMDKMYHRGIFTNKKKIFCTLRFSGTYRMGMIVGCVGDNITGLCIKGQMGWGLCGRDVWHGTPLTLRGHHLTQN